MITEEFFDQGDQERLHNIPLSPLCDREMGELGIANSQQGFIQYVARPQILEFSRWLNTKTYIDYLASNHNKWGSVIAEKDVVPPREAEKTKVSPKPAPPEK